jgi:hypothetical protein
VIFSPASNPCMSTKHLRIPSHSPCTIGLSQAKYANILIVQFCVLPNTEPANTKLTQTRLAQLNEAANTAARIFCASSSKVPMRIAKLGHTSALAIGEHPTAAFIPRGPFQRRHLAAPAPSLVRKAKLTLQAEVGRRLYSPQERNWRIVPDRSHRLEQRTS